MPALVLRTNPLHGSAETFGIYVIPSTGTATFDRPEEIAILQQNPSLREKLQDGSYDTGSTSTIQILDGGVLVPQAEAVRALTKTHRYDLFRQRFANAAARLADATVYTSADLYSFALQEDDGSIWYLSSISPTTWSLFKADATGNNHRTLRHLIHFIDSGPAGGFASGAYWELLPAADPFPTSEIWWESASKLKKIVSLDSTYNVNKTINTEVWKMYDTDGSTVLVTVTDTYTYSGVFPLSVTRTIA